MKELISTSIYLHLLFIYISLVLAIANLYIVKKVDDYIAMTKKFELFSLLYYLGISTIVFTGFIVLAAYKFHFTYTIYLMLLVAVFIIIGSFKTHKLFKRTRLKNINSQKKFQTFAIKKYLADILSLITMLILAFIFSS